MSAGDEPWMTFCAADKATLFEVVSVVRDAWMIVFRVFSRPVREEGLTGEDFGGTHCKAV